MAKVMERERLSLSLVNKCVATDFRAPKFTGGAPLFCYKNKKMKRLQ